MSHGFYLVYDGPHPDLAQLSLFWHDAAHAAGLVDPQPWERTADVIEHVAGVGDLDVELVIFIDGDQPREVSIEGHWSSDAPPRRTALWCAPRRRSSWPPGVASRTSTAEPA